MSETPTHFTAVCPHCLMALRVPSEYSGQNCPLQALRPEIPRALTRPSATPGSSDYSTAAVNVPGTGSDRLAVNCPNCGTGLSMRRAYAGQNVRCGQCGQKFPVSPAGEPGAGVESDIFSQLYNALAEGPSGDPSAHPTSQGAISEEQFAAISGERDELRRGGALRQEQRASEGEREQIRAERDRLDADLARVRGKRDKLRAERDRIYGDCVAIEKERDSLRAELEPLRAELSRSTAPSCTSKPNGRISGGIPRSSEPNWIRSGKPWDRPAPSRSALSGTSTPRSNPKPRSYAGRFKPSSPSCPLAGGSPRL